MKFYNKLFPSYERELKKATSGCQTLLDLGCGQESPIKSFSNSFYSVGIDIYPPAISKSRNQKIHDSYYQMNVFDIEDKFEPKSFDCVLASDIIEHFEKKGSLKLIEMMEKIAKKKVIIFTPNGFLKQKDYDGNPWQVHKSGWTVEEFEKIGYKVIGIHGLKNLRTNLAEIRYSPKHFWLLISDISQIYVRNFPKHAFQLLCIKNF